MGAVLVEWRKKTGLEWKKGHGDSEEMQFLSFAANREK
jgi:hypothetical protein